ncbi:MAG: homoserine O-acetyltransferase [Sedimentisphaerales bacterium]|nr:homoserine O-acetyltransferase [Sedimentisphaerales bacterium]
METHQDNSVGIVETRIVRVVEADAPLILAGGKTLGPIDIAYETYGILNEARDNTVLICHALSGNAHVAGYSGSDDRKPGWWDEMIGPGKGIDTNKYFVICSNVLGGCCGTTGPSSVNPATGKPYGLEFPIITIADMVNVQKRLLDKLGIKKLLCVVGGSMGGMQVLQWAIAYPDMVQSAAAIATTTRLGAQAIAFDAVGRNAILADGCFANGQYHDKGMPAQGLAIARMVGHITYLSEAGMHEKFGRQLRQAQDYRYDFHSEFAVETYLDYQGQTFVERFDANSYLYITKAMDYFDLAKEHGDLPAAFAGTKCKFLVVSFSSDWLFTPKQSEEICDALTSLCRQVSYCNIDSPYGHDAFLLEPETLCRILSGFLDNAYGELRGVSDRSVKGPSPQYKVHDHARRVRVDYELIESLIEPESKVLDVGCGDGELLAQLIRDKRIRAEGIELDQDMVVHCIGRGLPVIQRDIERGLGTYCQQCFDYAILSQTVQTVKDPALVLREMHRVAKKVIVSFPNFAHWICRMQLLLAGRAPVTRQLPFGWHNSPNIHFLSLRDFDDFCQELGYEIEKKIPLSKHRIAPVRFLPNLLAAQAVYVTCRREG